MDELQLNSVVRVAVGPLAERLGDEIAILDPASGLYFGLNEVGARIWELLQEPKSLGEVARTLTDEYEVNLERCQADVLALASRLLQAKLVEVTSEKPA